MWRAAGEAVWMNLTPEKPITRLAIPFPWVVQSLQVVGLRGLLCDDKRDSFIWHVPHAHFEKPFKAV